MDTKHIKNKQKIKQIMIIQTFAGNVLLYKLQKNKGGEKMLKTLAKLAEKYAKSTNTACFVAGVFHQPKMPASLIKKD